MKLSTKIAVAASVTLGLAIVPVVAQKKPAGAPPERYTCYQFSYPGNYAYMGFFRLAKNGTYQYGSGAEGDEAIFGKGRYKTAGKSVTFVTGPLKGVPGVYRLYEGKRHFIDLTFPGKTAGKKDDIEQSCNCSEHD